MDEFPVGGGGGGGMGGMGGSAPAEEDYSKLSIEDRLASKVWKARVSAYEELVKQFEKSPSEEASIFKPYTRNPDLVKAMVTDSNAVAQEKALETLKAFLTFGGRSAGQTREVVMPSVVEKCLGAMRAGTKKSAIEIASLYAEHEDVMGSEGVVLTLLNGTAAKQPKVVQGAVSALTQLAGEFGPKQVTFKPILKKLPDIFGHSDKTVRAEASLLAQELHKWIGSALEPTLAALKDIQAKELREQFAKIDSAGQKRNSPSRYLISQRPLNDDEQTGASGAEGLNGDSANIASGDDAAEEVDAFEFLEPKDPLKDRDWPENFDEMIMSTKWLERKEVLDQCIRVLERTPRIVHTMHLDSLIDILCEKVKRDANINVVLSACQCIQKFALGLRGDFAKNKEKALPALLEKLKERKESTVKVLSDTLDAVFQTVTISDVLEQTLNATKHKNPQVKTGAIQFLVRCLRETRSMPAKGDVKPIADALVGATADGSADVRDAGAQGLGTLMKLIGERAMIQYIDGLDDIKKGKIQEQFKTATVKVKQNGPSRPAAAAAAAAAAAPALGAAKPKPRAPAPASAPAAVRKAVGVNGVEKENTPPALARASPSKPPAAAAPTPRGPPARLVAGRTQPPASASRPTPTASKPRPAAAGPSSSKAGASKGALAANEPVKYRFHPDEAEGRANEFVPIPIQEELSTSVWKDRLAAMVKFNEWLKLECETAESEIIVRFLSKKPGWKESNFQVMAEVYNALRMLANDCPTFGRPSIAMSVTPLCDKLGDIKLKGPAGETLVLFAEKTSIGFVISQALGPLANLKAPKAIADSLLWINQVILEFGTANIDVRGLVAHLLNSLKSANAAVRTNATTTIGTLSRFLGPALSNMLGDINPQLRSTVEAEIEKVSKEAAPTPVRFGEESRPKASAAAEEASGGAAATSAQDEEDALDALIPRVDLDNLVSSETVAKIGDANWKERKEGLEDVNAVLDANTRLKPKIGELATALKMRCADNNVQCRTLALEAIGKIATGMGRGFDTHVRTFVVPVTQVLADAKAPMRAGAAKALTAMAQQAGVAPMISGFVSVLESKTANPMLRQDLFTWLGEWLEGHPPDKMVEMNGLALPAIICLDDKLAAVRKAAQSVLPFIILRAGYKFVMEQTSGLKAASRNTVVPLIDAAKAQASSKGPPPPPPSTGVSARLGGDTAAAQRRAPNVVRRTQPSTEEATTKPAAVSHHVGASVAKAPSAIGRTLRAPGTQSRPLSVSDGGASSDDAGAARLPRVGVRKPIGANGASTTSSIIRGSSSSTTPMDKSAPFVSSDTKFKVLREKREGGRNSLYWIGAEAAPRPELSEALRQQCEPHISGSLIDTMFSKDHNAERDYLAALTLFIDFLSHPEAALDEYGIEPEEAVARSIANSDLLFKYVAIRLTDNNTSIALKCLDVLDHLIALLRKQEYHMTDYEANAVLPCVIAKFGDPKVAFRDRIRADILRKITYIFPPSKVLTHYLEEGLTSKNARVRTECLAEVGQLFHKNGTQFCSLSKILPQVGKQIADRDAAVRTAALMAVSEVYKLIGDDVWQHVGQLSLKESSLLEERLKRTAAPSGHATAQPARDTTPLGTGNGPNLSANANVVRQQVSRASLLPSATAAPVPQAAPAAQSKLAIPTRLARQSSTPLAPSNASSSTGNGQSNAARASRLPAPSGIARPTSIRMPGSSTSASGSAHSRTPSAHSVAVSSSDEPTTTASQTRQTASHDDQLTRRTVAKTENVARASSALSNAAPHNTEEDLATEQAINEIMSSDCDASVMALKKVEQELQRIAPSLTRHADQLAIAFGKQLHRAFRMTDQGSGSNTERLKKHLLITGTSVFDNTRLWDDPIGEGPPRTLGSFVTRSALVSLLTELLQQLIETKGATDEETQTHGRYLNVIILRSFSSCNLNVLFGACLQMLTEATEDMEELQERADDQLLDKRVKFADLICKCIWKMTRRLNASLQDELIDPVILLQDLERFLQATPPSKWKQRAASEVPLGEMPLRTVKVIITHIGSVFGEESLDLLEGIANPEQSYVYAHLLKVCDRRAGTTGMPLSHEEAMEAAESQPSSPQSIRTVLTTHTQDEQSPVVPQSPRSTRSAGSSIIAQSALQAAHAAAAAGSTDALSGSANDSGEDRDEAAANAELRTIFDRIANKAETQAAIRDLYFFQRKYPHKEPSIRRSLEHTGPIFQKYIKRALANHARDNGESLSPSLGGEAGVYASGHDDSTAAHRRDSIFSSPAGLGGSSARNSFAMSTSANGSPNVMRNSYMSPSSSRTNLNLANFSPKIGNNGGVAPSTPSAFLSRASSTTRSPLPSSPSLGRNSADEDRLNQLRAKFARSSSNHTGNDVTSS